MQTHQNRILFLTWLSLILPATLLRGQSDSVSLGHSLAQGAWALEFSISSDFELSSFKGTMLSAKYHVSAMNAIRVGVSANMTFSSMDQGNYTHESRDYEFFEVPSEYLFYSQPRPEIFFFWGVGPVVRFTRSYSKHVYDYPPSNSAQIYKTQAWGVGPSAVVGVEWFATRWLSLHGEYGLRALYTKGTSTSEYTDTYNPPSTYSITTEEFTVSSSPVMLGVSIYL